MKSGNRWIQLSVIASGALQIAACGDIDYTESATRPIDLPAGIAEAVYSGHAREGRAIAFVQEGRLYVAEQDQGIVFALVPAHGDTPPLVLAIATELVEPRGAADAVALKTVMLAHMQTGQRTPDADPLRVLP